MSLQSVYPDLPQSPTMDDTYNPWVDLISTKVLEHDPERYHQLLQHCIDNQIDVTDIINDRTEYHTWYSNHIMCLSYIVGDLENTPDDDSRFYGKNTVVNDHLGVNILNCLLKLGVDYDGKNYYGEDVFQSLASEHTLTKRIHNETFKKMIHNIRRSASP